jgi:hypothetical protein
VKSTSFHVATSFLDPNKPSLRKILCWSGSKVTIVHKENNCKLNSFHQSFYFIYCSIFFHIPMVPWVFGAEVFLLLVYTDLALVSTLCLYLETWATQLAKTKYALQKHYYFLWSKILPGPMYMIAWSYQYSPITVRNWFAGFQQTTNCQCWVMTDD